MAKDKKVKKVKSKREKIKKKKHPRKRKSENLLEKIISKV